MKIKVAKYISKFLVENHITDCFIGILGKIKMIVANHPDV